MRTRSSNRARDQGAGRRRGGCGDRRPDRSSPCFRDGASVTLEPGSQLELSGAPLASLPTRSAPSFALTLPRSHPFSQEKIRWLGLGFHPFATRDAFTMVPKQRYSIMREYLPTRGSMALDMMLRTSTVQANYDYLSEADAMTKMRVALKLTRSRRRCCELALL